MHHTKPRLSQDDVGKLIALWAVLIGAFLYLYQPWLAGFPINDGGLFYSMIRTIQQNDFQLPQQVAYNGLSIPFAYPPLALYLGALLSSLLHLDPITILQWLPACILIAISITFYFLARRLLDSPIAAGIATFLYMCTPRSATWLIMGGGLTRGFGHLFLLLTVLHVYSLYTRRERRYIYLSTMAGSLVVLTHPEAALHTVAACALCWIIKGRTRRATLDSLWIGAGVALVTAIWWVPVLLRHSGAPFVAAGGTGWEFTVNLIKPLFLTFSEEPMMTLVPVLGLIGLAASLARNEYFLPAWFGLPFLVDPRSAATVAIVPGVLLAAKALDGVIFPGIAGKQSVTTWAEIPGPYHRPAVRLLLSFLGVYMLIMALYAGMELSRVRVSPENRTAFNWVAQHTPLGSRFIILDGTTEMFCSPVQEWFPAITARISQTTIQGYEWVGNGRFFERLTGLQDMQLCQYEIEPGACVLNKAAALGLDFDYVYVTRQTALTHDCRTGTERHIGDEMVNELLAGGGYATVYETEAVEILGVVP